MADLIFYTNPQSRGRIIRWMLEEVGQPYETEVIAYDQIKSERFLAVNPMGKVPAIRHRGHVVTECAAGLHQRHVGRLLCQVTQRGLTALLHHCSVDRGNR